jgi:hypothetical protein
VVLSTLPLQFSGLNPFGSSGYQVEVSGFLLKVDMHNNVILVVPELEDIGSKLYKPLSNIAESTTYDGIPTKNWRQA